MAKLDSLQYGFRAALQVAEAIRNNNDTVLTIDLDHNKIGPEGAIVLAGAIQDNNTIQTIDLDHNKIGNEGAIALAGAIRNSNTIHTINLAGNKIGTVSYTHLTLPTICSV